MKRKLQLHRDTIVRLTPVEVQAVQGGQLVTVTQDRSCMIGSCGCSLQTCGISCGGTCFQHTCVAAICGL